MAKKPKPKEAVTIYNNAQELSNKKKYKEAIDEYNKAIDIFPQFIEAYNNIGEIFSKLNNNKQAIATYMKALQIERNYKILLNIGVEYYNKNEYDTSLNYFLESVKQDRMFLEGNYYSAITYYNLKDMNNAETYFNRVLENDGKHHDANFFLSSIYYERKDYQKALQCLDIIKDTTKNSLFIHKYYGFCCYFVGRYEEAIDYLTSALKSQPNYNKYKSFLKTITYENKIKEIGNIDKEIKKLENKISTSKTTLNEVTKLSMLYIFKGKNNKAEKLLLEAKEKLAS